MSSLTPARPMLTAVDALTLVQEQHPSQILRKPSHILSLATVSALCAPVVTAEALIVETASGKLNNNLRCPWCRKCLGNRQVREAHTCKKMIKRGRQRSRQVLASTRTVQETRPCNTLLHPQHVLQAHIDDAVAEEAPTRPSPPTSARLVHEPTLLAMVRCRPHVKPDGVPLSKWRRMISKGKAAAPPATREAKLLNVTFRLRGVA